MTSFEVKRNRKTQKDVKLNALHNGYLVFLDIFSQFLPHKTANFDFSEINDYKSKTLKFIETHTYGQQLPAVQLYQAHTIGIKTLHAASVKTSVDFFLIAVGYLSRNKMCPHLQWPLYRWALLLDVT